MYKILAEGFNFERLMCRLADKGIALKRVKRTGRKRLEMCVSARDKAVVVDLLSKQCYNVLQVVPVGPARLSAFARANVITVCLLLLCMLAVAVCSTFCLRIEIDADCDRAQILTLLSEAGIGVGKNLSAFKPDAAENYLTTKLDDAMQVIISRRASTVYVSVKPKTQKPPPLQIADIVAPCAGRIIRVVLGSGTAHVAAGETVQAGQVLVEARRYYSDGTSEKVAATGQVFIEVSATGVAEYAPLVLEYTRSGKYITRTHLRLGKAEILSKKQNPYEFYESEMTEAVLYPLAIRIFEEKLYELVPIVVEYTYEAQKLSLIERAEAEARSAANFEILRTEYIEKGHTITVIVYGTVKVGGV